MDKKPAIDFGEPTLKPVMKKGFARADSSLADTLNQVDFKSLIEHERKQSEGKKLRAPTKSEEEIKMQEVKVLFSFSISVPLLNLLRNPMVADHKFEQQWLEKLRTNLRSVCSQNHCPECRQISLYFHLILAQVENLSEMEELSQGGYLVPLNIEKWNTTNVINHKTLLILLSRLPEGGPKSQKTIEIGKDELEIQIIDNSNAYLLENGVMKISKNYVKTAMESQGHLDVYFGPFLVNKFSFEAHLWFTRFKHNGDALSNYSDIFKQVVKDSSEYASFDFEEWYHEQVNKIVNNQFFKEDLITILNFTRYNPWVEKLLIGLQGWKSCTDTAIKLLNVYYDNCDWQLTSEYNPVVNVTGDNFMINYLIDNPKPNHQSIIYCLNAPCFDDSIPIEVFSWHIPKLVEYNYDEISYVWAQMDFGKFPRSGFYNFVMFNLFDHGKEPVSKVVDIGIKGKIEKELKAAQTGNLHIMTVRSVKGRMIVQPPNTRELSLHEINIDALAPEKGLYRTSTFEDALKEIQKYQDYGINTVYLSGIFERDNECTKEVYLKPNASPYAFTHRTFACRMLGGQEGLKKLIAKAHQLGIKVMVDCSIRVSSSRLAKRYQKLRLKSIDEHGKMSYHYGANGKSISYDDTTPLNYRKKEAWDLLISEALQVIDKYQVDGFYMDNGFQWPPIFKLNDVQLYRRDIEGNLPAYTDSEIFEGEVIVPKQSAGFWASPLSTIYPNPFIVNFCKKMWEKHPKLLLISESLDIQDQQVRMINMIRSGPIPRSFQLPKALSQLVGVHLSSSGSISQIPQKNVGHLKKWYDQVTRNLPKGSIIIHSTTSPIWPYMSSIFKRLTWAIIDLMFLMPNLIMTSDFELEGKGYKSKVININYLPHDPDRVEGSNIAFDRSQSSFFKDDYARTKRGTLIHCSNNVLKDPSQIKYLEEGLRREVGPEFGYDLAEICKHYAHRRQLRKELKILREGRLMLITAEHIYGIHNSVLSFVRYDEEAIMLISINLNSNPIDMHYNLTPLKALFKKYDRSNKVVKLQSLLKPQRFQDEFYLVSELINSKIQLNIQPFSTSIWKLTLQEGKLEEAIACSGQRIKERLNRQPPAWIYSSIFFNELSYLLDIAKTKTGIVQGLNQLYKKCIEPFKIDFTLFMSKNHEFYINKRKLEKVFGIFQLISKHPDLSPDLQKSLESMVTENKLGPIAFVTPEIGKWSTVGGLGVMIDELSKELARIGEEVYIVTPYYQFNKKKETNYLIQDGFKHQMNIRIKQAHFEHEFGIHTGKYSGVNYIWFHNPELFSKPYDGEGAFYVSKQLSFFALITLESFCQLKIFPSMIVTNDWMCGFVSAYSKHRGYDVFHGTKFMHIVHNLDPLYQGRLYPKVEEGDLGWLIGLPPHWYIEHKNNKLVINPSKCALETCDNWGTVSNSYKIELLRESDIAGVLWKHPHPFSFPNGIRKDERTSILKTKTPGNHKDSKLLLQQRYFHEQEGKDVPLMAFIGRVTRQKGVHLILESIQSLLYEYNFQIQFLIGGMADSKQQYGKYCAEKMKFLNHKFPHCFWSNPDMFFSDGPLVNIGSDFAIMPSMFEPGGIVQHEFFCGGTPVITFCTGGLKDTVFEYDPKTQKGNGFNFMSYDLDDFKRCMRRALECYKNKAAYEKLRENAVESVVEEEDVARGWNNEFYRMQNKIYIDRARVETEIQRFTKSKENEADTESVEQVHVFDFQGSEYWKPTWEVVRIFKEVLQSASRLKVKSHTFQYETKKIPRPKEVFVIGSWDDWKSKNQLVFSKTAKNYKISLKLKPDIYYYKYIVDGEWVLAEHQDTAEEDQHGHINHKVVIE